MPAAEPEDWATVVLMPTFGGGGLGGGADACGGAGWDCDEDDADAVPCRADFGAADDGDACGVGPG